MKTHGLAQQRFYIHPKRRHCFFLEMITSNTEKQLPSVALCFLRQRFDAHTFIFHKKDSNFSLPYNLTY